MESLALMGQADGTARIAGMLIHLFDRLSALGQADGGAIPMPLTQGQIGDLVGLTPVHVSRRLGDMERAGLIQRGSKTITLADSERLRALAGLPVHEFPFDPGWIVFPNDEP